MQPTTPRSCAWRRASNARHPAVRRDRADRRHRVPRRGGPDRLGAVAVMRACNCGSGLESEELLDARGIYCGRVCAACEVEKRAQFRPEIFTDSRYEASEPIEED